MNKIVVIVTVILFFTQIIPAQNKRNFEPKTKADHVLFAISAIEHDSDYVSALDYINEAIAMDDSDAFCYAVKGNILLILKDYKLAWFNFDLALKVSPDDFANFLGRAKSLYFLKEYHRASKDLNQAIELEPLDADIYLWRSKVRKALGDTTGAESDMQVYFRINGPN